MRPFTYQVKTDVVYGSGTLRRVGDLAKSLGSRALIVCTGGAWRAGVIDRITGLLTQAGIGFKIFSGVVPNPTTESVNLGVDEAKRFNADFVIGFGGGSSMDTAKAIAVGVSHPGEAWEYRLWQKPIADSTLPIMAITTTAGSGAEVTCVAVVTKTDEHLKFALADPRLFPKIAIVDPELTLTLPARVTAASGFDAYCHAFECVLNKNANRISTCRPLGRCDSWSIICRPLWRIRAILQHARHSRLPTR